MSEKRRTSSGPRGRRTYRPRPRRTEGSDPVDATLYDEQDAPPAELDNAEHYDEPADRNDAIDQEFDESEKHSQRAPSHRHERIDEEPGEPYETQPGFLGRSSDVDSQPSDHFSIETHFDQHAGQFCGSILEFPDLKASGQNREVVMADLEAQLGQKLEAIRQEGGDLPEPICSREYPQNLTIPISQSLYRRLDRASRFEKIEIEKLVSELLVRALEKRTEASAFRGGGDRRIQSATSHQNNHRHSSHRHQNRRGGNHPNRGGGNRSYHDSMNNKENFLEYVRNLENRRNSSNWRKK